MHGDSPLLRLRAVSVDYGSTSVLRDLDLDLRRGEWAAVIGPNGSGKSTLLNCVVGRVPAASGTVTIDGLNLATQPAAAKCRLGYAVTPQSLPGDLTGRQCLEVFCLTRQMSDVDEPTSTLAGELDLVEHLDQPLSTYSLGTRQKLAVVLAALGSPPLLVLDEVFNGLDPASALTLKAHLQARVNQGACSVLLATHDLSTVDSYCTGAHLLLDGSLHTSWNRAELAHARQERGRLEVEMAAAFGRHRFPAENG